MKILITGANGTVGQLLHMHIAPWHHVKALQGRRELDLMNSQDVNKFFTGQHFDCVIHCATAGVNDTAGRDSLVAQQNLTMWENLSAQGPRFNRLINIASGCELGGGSQRAEHNLFDQFPVSAYGLSKNLIAREVARTQGWYNLRLFGIIANTRVFKALWDAVDAGVKTFDVVNDKYMDYIMEDDLAKIVHYYIDSKVTLPADINMVYKDKYLVSEVLQRYIDYHGIDMKLNIINSVPAEFDYTGDGTILAGLNIL